MENQNILTIKFNTLDDLAVQVADWNERLNHQCQGQCMSEKPIVKVASGTSLELAESKLEDTFKKAIQKSSKKIAEGITRLEAEGCKVKILENKVSAPADDVPVTDFEGNPTKLNKEEKVKPAATPKPAETTKVEEQTPIETLKQDTELDIAAEPVDKKAFYKEFRAWMGEDGAKAKKAIAIFGKHGVSRPSSDSLTDDLITDLKSIMAEKEA
ncbi:choline-binding protein A [Veillonella tobetsuensis]|uniref:choline-binding protein A n=1 Tax=Veillonella tobetsuensis TaxID=1110546 RepID=UPI00248F44B8|nr:choline-binding protein A [Veillonella tobetsuensis]